MSAYIVSKTHIDILIAAGLAYGSGYDGITWNESASANRVEYRPRTLDHTTADAVGRMLWAECLESVAYRYPNDASGERPGPAGFEDWHVMVYEYKTIDGLIDPVTVLAAINAYEYQSCEHPGWDTSEANRFCEALRHFAITRLPGYKSASIADFDDRRIFLSKVA